jgi:hypothetical protein
MNCKWISSEGPCTVITTTGLCKRHSVIINDYIPITNEKDCSISKEIKIIPRSKEHILSVAKSLGYEYSESVTKFDVCQPGGFIDEGDISDPEYIQLQSDNSVYYYTSKRGSLKAKDLKIKFISYCTGTPVISVRGLKYCSECYTQKKFTKNKLINCPTIDFVRVYFSQDLKKSPTVPESLTGPVPESLTGPVPESIAPTVSEVPSLHPLT